VAMFGKEESRSMGRTAANETTLSIISTGTTISGDIECGGVLKVEGTIDGGVRNARQVMLAKGGTIRGDVTAQEIVVGGAIDGNVTAGDRIELQSTAVVNGEISTKSIVVMEGARINGGVRMSELALVSRGVDERDARGARGGR